MLDISFRTGDPVWIMTRNGEWQLGSVYTLRDYSVQVMIAHLGTSEWRHAYVLSAESALGLAIEAVKKAKEKVVVQASHWKMNGCVNGTDLLNAVDVMHDAERVEAAARKNLEELEKALVSIASK